MKKLKIDLDPCYLSSLYGPHPTLLKLKIECDQGNITSEILALIGSQKLIGFRLRVHWNKCTYKYEDMIRIIEESPTVIFYLRSRFEEQSLLTFYDALKLIYLGPISQRTQPKRDRDPVADSYNAKGFKMLASFNQIVPLVKNHEPYFKGLIREFIKENFTNLDTNRKLGQALIDLPQVAINDYLTDF